jgi:hypothetical protein
MKTFNSVLAVMAIALLLSAASALRAGPSPDQQNRMRPTVTKAAPTPPAACSQAGQVCSNCQSCASCPAPAAKKATS